MQLTNEMYWLAQPPVVRKLRDLIDAPKIAYARQLQAAGVSIDADIMLYKFDAGVVMRDRAARGYEYVVPWAPLGVNADTYPMYGPVPATFPGAIKVSDRAEDYKPYDDPPAPTLLVSDRRVPGFENGVYYGGRGQIEVRLGTELGDSFGPFTNAYESGRHWRKMPATSAADNAGTEPRNRLPEVPYWLQIPA